MSVLRSTRDRLGRFLEGESSTSAGRSLVRYRRAALTSATTAAARGISIFTLLVSIPLALRYLGPERFGLWATISSFLAILAFADIGLGNALVTALSKATGRDDRDAASAYVSSAFFLLLALGLVLGATFALAYPRISWGAVYNVDSSEVAREAGHATAVFAACFVASLPARLVEQVQLGFQEGYVNGLWATFGSLLGLAGVLTGVALEAPLPWLVLAVAGAPLAALILNGASLFLRRRPWLRPRAGNVGRDALRVLFRLGGLFFVLQLAFALTMSSDNVIVIRLFGPEAVAEYSVATRIFTAVPFLLAMLFSPLWPAYGEALARGDVAWARTALVRSLLLALTVTVAASTVLVAFGLELVRLWTDGAVTPSLWLLAGLGVWAVLWSAGNALAMFLNGAGVIGFQAVTAIVMATAAVAAKIGFGSLFGLPGVVWGTVVAYTLFTVIPFAFVTPRLLARVQSLGQPERQTAPTVS